MDNVVVVDLVDWAYVLQEMTDFHQWPACSASVATPANPGDNSIHDSWDRANKGI